MLLKRNAPESPTWNERNNLSARQHADHQGPPDLAHVFAQYAAIEPWLHSKTPEPEKERLQSPGPQLTSVLSIANRVTGLILSLGAVGLVVWLSAAAAGPRSYGIVQSVIKSWAGQVVLFGCTFAFFLHLCGGIRHRVWDTVHGFELRSIYISGWTIVAASVVLTAAAWTISLFVAGWHL